LSSPSSWAGSIALGSGSNELVNVVAALDGIPLPLIDSTVNSGTIASGTSTSNGTMSLSSGIIRNGSFTLVGSSYIAIIGNPVVLGTF
jgi:hypothetical protein